MSLHRRGKMGIRIKQRLGRILPENIPDERIGEQEIEEPEMIELAFADEHVRHGREEIPWRCMAGKPAREQGHERREKDIADKEGKQYPPCSVPQPILGAFLSDDKTSKESGHRKKGRHPECMEDEQGGVEGLRGPRIIHITREIHGVGITRLEEHAEDHHQRAQSIIAMPSGIVSLFHYAMYHLDVTHATFQCPRVDPAEGQN